MANREYIERIKSVILHLHGCQSSWMESVTVQEIFCGLTAWMEDVEVFAPPGLSKAKKACAWSHADGKDDKEQRFVTGLEIPPVDSPQTAVKVTIAAEARGKK